MTCTAPPAPALPPEAEKPTTPLVLLPPLPAWPATLCAIRPSAPPPLVVSEPLMSIVTGPDGPVLPPAPPEEKVPSPPLPPALPRL